MTSWAMTTEIEQARKVRRLLAVVCVCLLVVPFTPTTHAQGKKTGEGANGPISKEKLIAHFQYKKVVRREVIKADDIIEIIRSTDQDITIEYSTIEGGLYFGRLPKTRLENVKLPDAWSHKEKEEV